MMHFDSSDDSRHWIDHGLTGMLNMMNAKEEYIYAREDHDSVRI